MTVTIISIIFRKHRFKNRKP